MKRVFDIAFVAAAALPTLVIVAICAAIIRLTSPGPAIFRQERLGRNEKPFVCLKLRTMYVDTGDHPSHEVGASAVTPCGRVLRRLKLDELPQLWNVLVGDMSVVGPRPNLASQKDLIEMRRQAGIFTVRPGVTGFTQVAGLDMSDPVKLTAFDVAYLQQMSLWTDLKVIVRTVLGAGRRDAAAQ
ncbi:MAG: lipid carrier--UDP-N-acetylgalactosaminyltransferase [Hyphomicrobiales bacterium]|nr:MAG: lipid carrier--UDP-N-acetylgalactosaminyltransferase [Hyphomicrobiales bacterium]